MRPREEVGPKGWTLFRVIPWELRPSVCPFIFLNSSEYSPLRVKEGVNIPPRDQSLPLGAKTHVDCSGRCLFIWYILWPVGIFYGQLVYFMASWYILWPVGIFYGQLVYF
jgi:hypothetical protein